MPLHWLLLPCSARHSDSASPPAVIPPLDMALAMIPPTVMILPLDIPPLDMESAMIPPLDMVSLYTVACSYCGE